MVPISASDNTKSEFEILAATSAIVNLNELWRDACAPVLGGGRHERRDRAVRLLVHGARRRHTCAGQNLDHGREILKQQAFLPNERIVQ
jgi:hypothetical protein